MADNVLTLVEIALVDLDHNLAEDIRGETADWKAYEARERADDITFWHVVFSADIRRGGAVIVGSGSSGLSTWTDAASADETLQRVVTDACIG